MYCPYCLKFINEHQPEVCPHCGANLKRKSKSKNFPSINLSPKIKKILIGFFALLLLVAFFDFGENDSGYSSVLSAPSSSQVQDNVIINDSNMTVTFKGAEDAVGVTAFYVNLRIENKMNEEVVATVRDADIDGETVQSVATGVPLRIRSGNSGQTGFIFPTGNLSIDSVKEADKATFKVVLLNDDFDVIAESPLVTIDLS